MKRLKKGEIDSMEEVVISLKSDKATKSAMKVGGIIGIVIGWVFGRGREQGACSVWSGSGRKRARPTALRCALGQT